MNKSLKVTKVALCIPAYGQQPPEFWAPLIEQMLDLQRHGIELTGPIIESSMAADRNRNAIARRALASDAEWTYWMDADNINPVKTLKRLLAAAGKSRKMVSGLYFLKQPPHRPVVYRRLPDGRYTNLDNWERGEILQVDAAGMNCVLIHRSVFEDIDAKYVALQRASGGIVPVHRDDIQGDLFDQTVSELDGSVIEGVWHQRMRLPSQPEQTPFFYLEYNRTEDMAFFEMAARLGHKLYVDTSIECGHLDWKVVTGSHYREALAASVAGSLPV